MGAAQVKASPVYAFRDGFPSGGMDPAEVAKELERISDGRLGSVTPEAVVEAARDPKSPMHAGFVWDDTKAAHEFRLAQARRLVRSVLVIYPDTTPRTVYVHVTAPKPKAEAGNDQPGGYYPMSVVVKSESLYERAVAELKGKLRSLAASVDQLESLAESTKRRKAAAAVRKHIEAASVAADGLA